MACNTIVDGTGSGNQAKVDSDNRLQTVAVIESLEHYANHEKGNSFSVQFSVTPTGANDCFFYLKNTGTVDIVVEGFGSYVASNEIIEVKLRDSGIPSGGSAITPVNLNTRSNNVATATVQDGNDITGLSGGSVAYRVRRAADNETKLFNFDQGIIVSPQQVLTMYAVNGSIAIEGFIDFYATNRLD